MLSENISSKMVQALNLSSTDIVVEIGAGLGAVTEKLSESLFEYGSHIYAVEIDERFISKLEQMFRESLNISIVKADILEWLPEQEFEHDFKVLGSLPYYITSPILHALVKLRKRPVRSVVLIQKEVGEKITAPPGGASYLSVFVQTFFDVTYLETVPKNVFSPEPKVDGAIVVLDRKEVTPPFDSLEVVDKYEGFLHKGFSSPRKMLNKPFKKEELARVGVDGTLRPQNLDVDTWKRMFVSLVLES